MKGTQSDIALKLSNLKNLEDLRFEFEDLLRSDPDFHYYEWEFNEWVEDYYITP